LQKDFCARFKAGLVQRWIATEISRAEIGGLKNEQLHEIFRKTFFHAYATFAEIQPNTVSVTSRA
jgi:hypothetical protein